MRILWQKHYKVIIIVISKMSRSQVYSNTDFVEQNNILNFLQQQQTL